MDTRKERKEKRRRKIKEELARMRRKRVGEWIGKREGKRQETAV